MRESDRGRIFKTWCYILLQGTAQVQADKRVVVKMAHMQKRTVGSGLSDDGKNPADILDTVIYEADKILIASGAAPRKLGLPGEELSEVMTSEELLQAKDRCYDRLVVVGGGVIGLEIATVFQALGSEVTVIELGERLLPSMDIEFAEALEKILVGRGIHVYKKSLIERFEKEENGVSCHLMSEGKKQILSADAVLVSVGREPYTEELFAADLKIRMDHGKVLVNEFFMTNIPGIYAIGDVIGGVQLAHVASAQAKYVVERMNNLEPSVILSIVPSCLFVSMSIIPNCLYLKSGRLQRSGCRLKKRQRGKASQCKPWALPDGRKWTDDFIKRGSGIYRSTVCRRQ